MIVTWRKETPLDGGSGDRGTQLVLLVEQMPQPDAGCQCAPRLMWYCSVLFSFFRIRSASRPGHIMWLAPRFPPLAPPLPAFLLLRIPKTDRPGPGWRLGPVKNTPSRLSYWERDAWARRPWRCVTARTNSTRSTSPPSRWAQGRLVVVGLWHCHCSV